MQVVLFCVLRHDCSIAGIYFLTHRMFFQEEDNNIGGRSEESIHIRSLNVSDWQTAISQAYKEYHKRLNYHEYIV